MLAEVICVTADRLARRGGNHLFGHPHQCVIVGVGLVELHHRESGLLCGNPLVPEIPVDLETPFESADGEALQIELRAIRR